ncbi:MAG: helix-turn-helix domain-containing protein [Caulobacteraceae bacterium]
MSTILLAINLTAIFNGLLIGGVLLLQERFGPARPRLTLAGFLIMTAVLLAVFVGLDGGGLRYSPRLELAMDAGALLVGGLLLDYVASTLSPRGLGLWPYAPTALYLAAAAVHGGRFGAPGNITHIVAIQIGLSAAAVIFWLRVRNNLPASWSRRAENRRLPVLLGGIGLFHAAQLLRLVEPGSSVLFNLVPLMGASGLLAFAAYAVAGSQTLHVLSRGYPGARRQGGGENLKEALHRSGAFLDPDLSLTKAANLLGMAPHALSRALNAQGSSFPQTVNALRINHAKEMLHDPAEARTSIDAISGLCGFRSRSRFYVAFQEEAGVTPAAFREAGAPPDSREMVRDRETGQGSV